jgi:hypothetical protein
VASTTKNFDKIDTWKPPVPFQWVHVQCLLRTRGVGQKGCQAGFKDLQSILFELLLFFVTDDEAKEPRACTIKLFRAVTVVMW